MVFANHRRLTWSAPRWHYANSRIPEAPEWTGWDVPPHRTFDRPRGADRRQTVTPGYTPERRTNRDRRRRITNPHLQAGWICFTAGPEKRRLYPPPPGWDSASDAELEALCERADDGTRLAQ